MANFHVLREALSFMDGGNAPFIESLYLIDNLNQMNAGNESCILGVLHNLKVKSTENRSLQITFIILIFLGKYNTVNDRG